MGQKLLRHPDFPCDAVQAIEAEVERSALRPDRLAVRYSLLDVTAGLVLPPRGAGRADGLWKHTCLEAFVQAAGAQGYRELNLSPGGPWASYRFDGYREGMANAAVGTPDVEVDDGEPRRLQFVAKWDLDLPADATWRVGVSAVIEEAGGRRSYWALKHPAGRPDFHDADCFVLEVPAPHRT